MADHTGSRDDRVGRARSITRMAIIATVVLLVLEPFVLSRLGNSSTSAVLVGILTLLALAPVMLIAAMIYLRFMQRQSFGEAVVGLDPPQRVATPARRDPRPSQQSQDGQPARGLTKERERPEPRQPDSVQPATPAPQPAAPPSQPLPPAAPAPTAVVQRPLVESKPSAYPVSAPAPQPVASFRLVLDDGETVDIHQPTVIGRQPASGTHEGEIAAPVDDNTRSISKVHARLTPRSGGVVVEDLGSTNGTLITAANGQHIRLTIGSPVMVPLGGTVQFGQRVARVVQ